MIGIAAALMSVFVNLATVVQFASLLLVFMYTLVAVAAIVSRFTQRDHLRRTGCPSRRCHRFWP